MEPDGTIDSALKACWNEPENLDNVQLVISLIEKEAISDYAKYFLRVAFAIECDVIRQQPKSLDERKKAIYELLDEADIYRGISQDSISVPEKVSYWLDKFWPPHYAFIFIEAGKRWVYKREKPRSMRSIGGYYSFASFENQTAALEQSILDHISQGKDVRYLTATQLEATDREFPHMVGTIYEGNNQLLSYSVRLLLTRLWKLAFGLFLEHPIAAAPNSEQLESRKELLLHRARDQNFQERLYAEKDQLYLGEKALSVHRWCTAFDNSKAYREALHRGVSRVGSHTDAEESAPCPASTVPEPIGGPAIAGMNENFTGTTSQTVSDVEMNSDNEDSIECPVIADIPTYYEYLTPQKPVEVRNLAILAIEKELNLSIMQAQFWDGSSEQPDSDVLSCLERLLNLAITVRNQNQDLKIEVNNWPEAVCKAEDKRSVLLGKLLSAIGKKNIIQVAPVFQDADLEELQSIEGELFNCRKRWNNPVIINTITI
ncbi:hypothetical protein GQ44DRAFT_778856 [Phaeosphaeriaceae sp. PMI808]|nr:hypothetical protein GQ44DRAFT_778856 [Phaeosphaeriaceae sp. PMI808]